MMLPIVAATGVDVDQLVDNDASRSIMETGRAHGAAERILYNQRCRIMDTSPQASVCVPVWIPRDRNWETDGLSKHLYIPVEGTSVRGRTGPDSKAPIGPDWQPTATAAQRAALISRVCVRFKGNPLTHIV